MKGIGKLLEKKYGELIFGLLGGVAYFLIVLRFVLDNTNTGGGLLGFFFAPLIICFPAILLIKFSRDLREKERFSAVNWLIIAHLVLLLIGMTTLIEIIIG